MGYNGTLRLTIGKEMESILREGGREGVREGGREEPMERKEEINK